MLALPLFLLHHHGCCVLPDGVDVLLGALGADVVVGVEGGRVVTSALLYSVHFFVDRLLAAGGGVLVVR